ncbi:MAG TPA: ABC transporter permease [Thermoanaerobaculia bacterium]|jgi:predicted permease|nr:ABC transporter permease [Thermoanaerobaculia bacterium]
MLTLLRETTARTRAFFRVGDLDRDFDQELESHLEMLAEDNVRGGMTPEQARRAAILRLGGLESTRQKHRDARGLPALESVLQDLRYAFRTLRRDAGFTTFAILILACGIGAASTIFSVTHEVLLRPLPFRDPGRLVWIQNGTAEGRSSRTVQVGYLLAMQESAASFSGFAAYNAFYGVGDLKLTGDGEPERLNAVPVATNFFSVLGVRPLLGREFTADEGPASEPRSVILGNRFWKQRFAADPNIVGRAITLNERPVTVVGVLPASFDFAAVLAPGTRVDVYLPFPLTMATNRWGDTLAIIGRLKPGATVQGAQAESTVLIDPVRRQHTDWNGFEPRMSALEEHVRGPIRPALLVLICAVGVVMLIVCANLSNLLLARAATRQKEMAVRAALGAGRGRLIRQLLTESLALCGCGAALGLLLAVTATHVLSRLSVFSIPLLGSVQVDRVALAFTLLVAVLTGLVFGLAPALRVPSLAVHDSLRDGARGSTGGRGLSWIRGGLVVSEVALACVLLVCAGLLIRSFLSVLSVDLGFQPERAAAVRVDPSERYSTQEKRNAYFDEVLRRVAAVPGVETAGLTDVLPLDGNRSWSVGADERVYARGERPQAYVRVVSPGYLKALGISLRAGRDFTMADRPFSENVILINETLARKLWPGQDAVGQRARLVDGPRRVIGVVGDVRHLALEKEAGAEMYLPLRQSNSYSAVDLVLRTSLPPAVLASTVRAALLPVEPSLPAGEFRPLQEIVDQAVSPRRFVVILLAGFSAFALLLASLGIYAVISYAVKQRTREFGIRMALGATARELQGRVLLQTLGLAGIGLLLGLAASWLLARTLGSLLFGVTPADPATYLGMVAILTAVAALAGYLPARRAARIDPLTAIRAD